MTLKQKDYHSIEWKHPWAVLSKLYQKKTDTGK